MNEKKTKPSYLVEQCTEFFCLFTENKTAMIYIPWGLIAIFIALFYFYTYNRKSRERRDEQREALNDKRQKMLDVILKTKKNKPENNEKTEY